MSAPRALASSPGTARQVVVPALPPLVVAALLAALGRSTAAFVLLAVAVFLPQALLLSPRFASGFHRVVHAVERAVGNVLGVVLLGPIFVLVLLPAGLLGHALRAPVLGARPAAGARTSWRSAAPAGRTRGRPFLQDRLTLAQPAGAGGGFRTVRIVLAVLALEAIVVAGVVLVRDRTDPEPQLGQASSALAGQSAALRDLPWAAATYQEMGELTQGSVYTPFTGLSLRDYEGETVNVQNRVRASYVTPLEAEQPPVDIWFFGGSTMFGFDLQRDEHTIPSEVVRLAEAEGIAVRATNFGAPGYVNFQETLLLAQALASREPPDLIVFYDGINDKSRALLNHYGGFAPPGEPSTLGDAQIRQALIETQFVPGATAEPPSPLAPDDEVAPGELTAERLVTDVVDVYADGVELGRTLATDAGVEVLHFWQPDLYSRTPLDPGEEEMLPELALDEGRLEVMRAFSSEVATALPEGVVDISDALDDVEGPVLADVVHLNEEGGRAVAVAMWDEGLREAVLSVRDG